MTIDQFSRTILKSSYHLWWKTLKGKCNLSYKRAKLVSSLLGTSIDVWLDCDFVAERQQAWKSYQEETV